MMSNRIPPTLALLSLLWITMAASVCLSWVPPRSGAPQVALPGCPDRCGDISIPYPFGIGEKCSHSSRFEVNCDLTTASLAALSWNFSGDTNPVEIISIDLGISTNVPTLAVRNPVLGYSGNAIEYVNMQQLDMRGSPYLLMGMRNVFVVKACGGSAVIKDSKDEIIAGCATVCTGNSTSPPESSSCYGNGCCQASVTTSLDYFQLGFLTTPIGNNEQTFGAITAALVDTNCNIAGTAASASSFVGNDKLPAILQWTVPDLPNSNNSRCVKNEDNNPPQGYHCRCKHDYYQGNPYLPDGCQVIKECEQCPLDCVSSGGKNTYGCPPKDKNKNKSVVPLALGLGVSFGTLCLVIMLYGLYQLLKKRKETRQKQKNFKKNGGLLLQQQMSATEGTIERTKVFTSIELEKATDGFNENRVLGRGGQGTVYKGMLADGTIVAIKKSKRVDERNLVQFINEVAILADINHRNVVKLYGCCLETEIPLLVYEFVPNGTLFHHIHHPSEDFRITWKMRLQIASESAEAFAYLHSSSSAPIYHRDIKTSNILLDDKYRAKVSDFGISKILSIDQTHATTRVQGTQGYIDPEFFQSHQFTEKSDVYSFGIVLLELLTGKKPFYVDRSMQTKSLASEFLLVMQNSCLYDIMDAEIVEEAQKEDIEGVANLAKQCLHFKGKQRPTMKEVAIALQMIKSQNRVPNESLQQIFNREELPGAIQICTKEGSSNYPSAYPLSSLFSAEHGR